MKVLMLSGDKHILEEGNEVNARFRLMSQEVDQLDVLVWPQVHTMRHVFEAARKNQYDVVTAQDPFWRGLVAWRAARIAGAKLNLQLHTVLSHESFVKRLIARFLLPRADSIRVVSELAREELLTKHLSADITVLPIYIELAPFTNVERHPHPRFEKVIIWIGRFESEKDPLNALRILKEVRAANIDAGLIMLGSGSMEKALKTAAKPISEYVEFPGWQYLPPYLAMADLVISTSKFESYGVSIILALAAGVPVVAPDVGIARRAGAIIAERLELGATTIEALRTDARGNLKLSLLNKSEWVKKWKESLV
jgi:glycosyltransferase involved in cell wall biosynthesis